MKLITRNSYKPTVDALIQLMVQYHDVCQLQGVAPGDVVGSRIGRDHPDQQIGEFTFLMNACANVTLNCAELFQHVDLATHLIEVARDRFQRTRSRQALLTIKLQEKNVNERYLERSIVFHPMSVSYTLITYTASIPKNHVFGGETESLQDEYKDKIAFVFAAE